MNKSVITNLIALVIVVFGYQSDNEFLLSAGLFALSGAMTNWLAVHMLFERIPGVYGSGVIQLRFDAFKSAIKQMMMEQFFNHDNIQRFLAPTPGTSTSMNLSAILDEVDFNPTFDSLVDVIMNSQFGGMLAMFGGAEALIPLKEPFVEKMKASVAEMGQSDDVQTAIAKQLTQGLSEEELKRHIEAIIEMRLSELTPQLVKEMVQSMIKEHLGWLVVWGGVFGAIIGVIAAYL